MAKYNLNVINAIRKDYCELCGSPAEGWPHHIKTRGAGGKDIPENLIQLCGECHRKVHNGKIHRRTLVEIVAVREGKTVKEIYEANRWLIDDKLPEEIEAANPIAGKTFEDVLELYLFCLEKGDNSIWERAALITVMYDYMKLKPRQIASSIGCSSDLCRKMVRTYNSFPREEDRIPFISFRHHQIASYTADPSKWIADAADNQWSTRQLQEEINKTKMTEENRKDLNWSKAEKALILMKEVLDVGDDAAVWLEEEIKKLTRIRRVS